MLDAVAEQGAHTLGAGRRHAGDEDTQARMCPLQGADEGRRSDALTHRHGMHPDVARRRQMARQALGQAAAIVGGMTAAQQHA